MNNYIDLTQAFDIMYGEERRREVEDVKSVQRDEKIGALAKEYFNDPGTFDEWIQSIEIDEANSKLYTALHSCLCNEFTNTAGVHVTEFYRRYCEEKATKDVNDE